MVKNRKEDLIRFYRLVDRLSEKTGGPHFLSNCGSRMTWPSRGVYFFMEPSEFRTDTGSGLRIVRIGTHGLKLGAKSTLWKRLSQHKGTSSGSGSHRGSIFRLLVGTSIAEHHQGCSTWGQGSTAKGEIRLRENAMEKAVSVIIRNMPFLFLDVDDAPAPESLRGFIERNSIALLSNFKKPPLDLPSKDWIGYRCDREKVRLSGLWNQKHVDENYDENFLSTLEMLIDKMRPSI